MKKKELYILIIITIIIFINKDIIYSSFNYSIQLFINNVFPSLFTFYILSNLLINYGFIELINGRFKVFNLSKNGLFIFIMSMISGFPSSSIYCSDFLKNNYISLSEANKLMIYTHFSNPLFIIMIVSNILNNKLAYIILICHYLSNFILAIIFRNIKIDNKTNYTIKINSLFDCIIDSIYKCFKTLLIVFSSIYIFILFYNLLIKYVPLNGYYRAIISMLFEITGGINNLSKLNISDSIKSILIGMGISFGGLSIHLQIKSIISDTSISYHQFLISRLLQSSITGILIYISLKIKLFI